MHRLRVYTKFIASAHSACTYLRTCGKLWLAASLAAYAYLLPVPPLSPTKNSYIQSIECREASCIGDSHDIAQFFKHSEVTYIRNHSAGMHEEVYRFFDSAFARVAYIHIRNRCIGAMFRLYGHNTDTEAYKFTNTGVLLLLWAY